MSIAGCQAFHNYKDLPNLGPKLAGPGDGSLLRMPGAETTQGIC